MSSWREHGSNGMSDGPAAIAQHDQHRQRAIDAMRKGDGSFFVVTDSDEGMKMLVLLYDEKTEEFLEACRQAIEEATRKARKAA